MPGFPPLCFPLIGFGVLSLRVLDVSCHPFYENLVWLRWVTSLCLDLSLDGERPSLCPPNALSLAFPQLLPQPVVQLGQPKLPSGCAHRALEALERATGAASGETGWPTGLRVFHLHASQSSTSASLKNAFQDKTLEHRINVLKTLS